MVCSVSSLEVLLCGKILIICKTSENNKLVELVRIKPYNHALIMLLPLYCPLIEGIMLASRTVNNYWSYMGSSMTI
jgi:hypothetical protein